MTVPKFKKPEKEKCSCGNLLSNKRYHFTKCNSCLHLVELQLKKGSIK